MTTEKRIEPASGPNFEKALIHTLAFEGGYAHHPADRGRETYRGISRACWPDWPGWKIVDKAKRWNSWAATVKQVDAVLMGWSDELEPLVKEFYRIHFWDAVGADDLPEQLARKVFDTAVNMGVRPAASLLQRSLNRLGETVKVDGIFGPRTGGALARAVERNGEPAIVDAYCREQRFYYERIIARDSSQAVFRKGWMRRTDFRG